MKPSTILLTLLVGGVQLLATDTSAVSGTSPTTETRTIQFSDDIKPVLEKSCVQCHGPAKSKAHFRVDSRAALLKGGESGKGAITPGNSASSPLVQYVADLVKEMEMPPLDNRDKYPALSAMEIRLLRAWIDQGAKWPEGVSLTPPLAQSAEKDRPTASPGRNKDHRIFRQIREGNLEGIADSLQEPSVLTARDESGNTPLIQAAFYLNAPQLALFLDKGADPNAKNSGGTTALMKGVWDIEKTRLLLKHGAKVSEASAGGNTPLIIASFACGSVEVVKELLSHGADLTAKNHAGANALMAAAEAGDAAVVRVLLDHGADPNSTARIVESNLSISALMIAAQMGHMDCVKLLLERGADVNLTTEHGNALHFAAFTNRREIARLLLDRGIKVNVQGRRLVSFRNDSGFTPLMYAASNETGDPTIVQWLIERGADLDAKASSGETALSLARMRGETKIVAALLAAGAKPGDALADSGKDDPRWTYSDLEKPGANLARTAAESGVALLLQSGARLNETTGNRCATCHQQSQPALAWALARERGFAYPVATASAQLADTVRAAKRRMEGAIEEPMPVPSIAAWLLIGLHAAGYPADTLTDYYAYSLARYQYGDGRWITKASRPPTDYSDVTSTALAIKALKLYTPPTMKPRFERMAAQAAAWLRSYEAQSSEERGMQILGLVWAGSDKSELQNLARALLAEQRKDGGWAQISSLPSDAYATGQSLYALYQAGALPDAEAAYLKGLNYLLRTQQKDGSWLVRTRASPVQVAIDGIFSHGKDQWISSVATSWSTMALMLAAPPEARNSADRK